MLKWYLLVQGNVHLLVLGIYHGWFGPCALVWTVPGLVLWGPVIGWQSHLVLELSQNLRHSAVLSTPGEMIICCPCRCSNSFLNSSYNACATCICGDQYVFVLSLTCNEMYLWSNQCLKKHHYMCCRVLFLFFVLTTISIFFSALWKKIIHFLVIFAVKWPSNFSPFVWFGLTLSRLLKYLSSVVVSLNYAAMSTQQLQVFTAWHS